MPELIQRERDETGQGRPSRCPRHARQAGSPRKDGATRIGLKELCSEPFRLFFPLALFAGVLGVLIWPLVFNGWVERAPGEIHTRLMTLGLFGGFMVGFLGTSLPRLFKATPFLWWETFPLCGLFVAASASYFLGEIGWGDSVCAGGAVVLSVLLLARFRNRREWPAPSFVLLIPSAACLIAGLAIGEMNRRFEISLEQMLLGRLLLYHGFVLISLLGAGAFLLPRFLRLGLRRRYEAIGPRDPAWFRSASLALSAGLFIGVSYLLDAFGLERIGGALRALLVLGYLAWEMPVERLRFSRLGVDPYLVLGLVLIPVGIVCSAWFAGLRVALSHLEMAGGFGLITLGVATRVVFGHTGQREMLERFHPWLVLSLGLMILGIATRIFGEMVPRLMISHYNYGAYCWIAGALVWGACVLTKVLRPDPEGS